MLSEVADLFSFRNVCQKSLAFQHDWVSTYVFSLEQETHVDTNGASDLDNLSVHELLLNFNIGVTEDG